MNERSRNDKEKHIYADALRKAALQYEELLSDLSAQRLFNDSLQVGMDFDEICRKLIMFLTQATSIENASVMVMDHRRKELRLLAAKGFLESDGKLFSECPWPGTVFKLGEGIAGMVAKTRTSILVNDTVNDPRFLTDERQHVKIGSLLCIPLIHGDHLHGVLNVSNSSPGAFDARKQHALSIIASTASVALSHALTSRKLRLSNKKLTARNKEFAAIISLSEALHTGLDPNAVLARSVENIFDGFDVEATAVFLQEKETGAVSLKFHKARARGSNAESLMEGVIPSFISEVLESGKPLVRAMPIEEGMVEHDRPASSSITCVGIPLISGNESLGVLVTVSPKGRELKRAEIRLLRSLCIQISMAIQNSVLVSRLMENIHELQETRHKLLQSDKLALLGEMLSGVAHEINNPLAAIMGYSELLMTDARLSEKNLRMLEKILHSVDRSRKIVHGLLSFARKTELRKEEIDITKTIERVIEHRDNDFKINNIEVIRDYANDVPVIIADQNQMEQVFLNIINNAFDALVATGTPGRLQVTTRIVENQWLQIEFVDNGPGVQVSDKDRVFEPFFTTKDIGKGTGLGLSVSYGIIKEHGGNFYLDRAYNQGAKFVVALPIAYAPETLTQRSIRDKTFEESRWQGRVLVVDDEELILDFLQVALTSNGFDVDCVSEGEKAYEMAVSTPYDLVITDLRMPGAMDGQALFAKLGSERPELAEHFLFISGDIMEKSTAQFLKESGRHFLLKPFSMNDLREAIDKTLASPSG